MFKFILTEYFLTKSTGPRSDKTVIPRREKLVFSNKTYKSVKKKLARLFYDEYLLEDFIGLVKIIS